MKSGINKKSAEILWSILTALSLTIAGLFMPVLYFVSYLPVVLIILRYGYRAGLFCFAMLGLVLLIISPRILRLQQEIPFAFTYLLVFGSLSIGVSIFIKQGFTACRVIGLSATLCVAMVLLWIVSANMVFKVNPVGDFREGLKSINRQVLESIENNPQAFPDSDAISKQEQMELRREQFKYLFDFTARVMGVFFVLFSVIGVGLSYIVGLRVFPSYGIRLMRLPKFSGWRPGAGMVWGLILGGVLYFWGIYSHTQAVNTIGLNIGLFFLVIYFVSGISITSYVLSRYKVPVIIRIIIYILFVIQYPFLTGIGIADVWFDFRRRMEAKEEKKTL